MPVTLEITAHAAKVWEGIKADDPTELLKHASPGQYEKCKEMLQSSFSTQLLKKNHITPSSNGLVDAAQNAYSTHHNLTIRPDDVWLAILTQFSFYINKHAEELRHVFVSHDDQKELVVQSCGTRYTVDFGDMAIRMTEAIQEHVKDPHLSEWVLPSFTTTTSTELIAASVLFMGTMQKYFSYTFDLDCGIPSVTLLGERADWADIRQRINKISEWGDEPALLAEYLAHILDHFLLSFDEPKAEAVANFWDRICHRHRRGSGPDYLSGWITAFCFWSDEGERATRGSGGYVYGDHNFGIIDCEDIPPGYAYVPVKVDDDGSEHPSIMIAGSLAIRAEPPTKPERNLGGLLPIEPAEMTDIRPEIGWYIFERFSDDEMAARKAAEEEKERLEEEAYIREIEAKISVLFEADDA